MTTDPTAPLCEVELIALKAHQSDDSRIEDLNRANISMLANIQRNQRDIDQCMGRKAATISAIARGRGIDLSQFMVEIVNRPDGMVGLKLIPRSV